MFKFAGKEGIQPEILKISEEIADIQTESLKQVKNSRDEAKATQCLQKIKEVAQTDENLIPYILEAARAYCSVGEIIDVLRGVFGVYKEESIF